MSDRRRNLFVLLTVVGLLIASLVVIFTKPTKLGLDLQGGVQLVYEARPTKQQPTVNQESLDRALDIMRDRVDSLGVAEPELQRSGANQIEVSLPGVSERRARRATRSAPRRRCTSTTGNRTSSTRTARRTRRRSTAASSRSPGSTTRSSRRPKCPPEVDANNTTTGLCYAFDKNSHEPINDGVPDETKAALEEDLAGAGPDRARPRSSRCPRAIIVLRAVDERDPEDQRGEVDQWWVHEGQPGPRRHRHQEPRAELRGRRRAARRSSRWSSRDKGRKAFAETTREIAQRGADNAAINGGLQDPISASHHFAIRLDNELITTPYINFRENPDGIDGSAGRRDLRRLHDPDRAGPRAAAQDRRAAGPARADLALAGLRHARPAGARPGPGRRHRGLRDRRALPARLLPRDGRHRGRRARASTRSTCSR